MAITPTMSYDDLKQQTDPKSQEEFAKVSAKIKAYFKDVVLEELLSKKGVGLFNGPATGSAQRLPSEAKRILGQLGKTAPSVSTEVRKKF